MSAVAGIRTHVLSSFKPECQRAVSLFPGSQHYSLQLAEEAEREEQERGVLPEPLLDVPPVRREPTSPRPHQLQRHRPDRRDDVENRRQGHRRRRKRRFGSRQRRRRQSGVLRPQSCQKQSLQVGKFRCQASKNNKLFVIFHLFDLFKPINTQTAQLRHFFHIYFQVP